jgi:hypothetical protein
MICDCGNQIDRDRNVLSISRYVFYHRMPCGRATGNSSAICDTQALSIRGHMRALELDVLADVLASEASQSLV